MSIAKNPMALLLNEIVKKTPIIRPTVEIADVFNGRLTQCQDFKLTSDRNHRTMTNSIRQGHRWKFLQETSVVD